MTQALLNNMVQQDHHASLLRGLGWRFKVSPSGYSARVRTTKTVLVSRRALTGCPVVFKAALDSTYHR